MKLLFELLRLRKRSDKVKLAMILFLMGFFLAGDVLWGVTEFFSMAGEPVEYVLNTGTEGARLDSKLQTILQRDSVICASFQREYALTSGSKRVLVTEVSPDYLSTCFGLNTAGAGSEFFLSTDVFKTFCGNSTLSPMRLTCNAGEENVSGTFTLYESLPGGLAVTKGTSLTLGDAQTIRVMLRGRDTSGIETNWFEENGFTIENREVVIETAHETEILIVRLRYGGAACVLSVLLGWQLFASGQREVK